MNIFIKLSYPNPIITAANVPPKTIIIGGIKNRALTDPPSSKNAPKMDIIPKAKPLIALYFLIISNQAMFGAKSLLQFFVKPAVKNPGSANPQLLLLNQHHFHSELIPAD